MQASRNGAIHWGDSPQHERRHHRQCN